MVRKLPFADIESFLTSGECEDTIDVMVERTSPPLYLYEPIQADSVLHRGGRLSVVRIQHVFSVILSLLARFPVVYYPSVFVVESYYIHLQL